MKEHSCKRFILDYMDIIVSCYFLYFLRHIILTLCDHYRSIIFLSIVLYCNSKVSRVGDDNISLWHILHHPSL